MRNVVIRLLLMQSVAAVIAAVAYGTVNGSGAAVAAIYGGLVALIMSLMLAWRIGQAAQSDRAMRWLVVGAAERMVVVCIAFAIGVGLIGIRPVPMLVGFGVSEFAYYLAAGPLRRYMLELMGRRYDGQ